MNREDIVNDWLDDASNRERLNKVAYDKPVFDFIKSTSNTWTFPYPPNIIYEVNGEFQQVVLKNSHLHEFSAVELP